MRSSTMGPPIEAVYRPPLGSGRGSSSGKKVRFVGEEVQEYQPNRKISDSSGTDNPPGILKSTKTTENYQISSWLQPCCNGKEERKNGELIDHPLLRDQFMDWPRPVTNYHKNDFYRIIITIKEANESLLMRLLNFQYIGLNEDGHLEIRIEEMGHLIDNMNPSLEPESIKEMLQKIDERLRKHYLEDDEAAKLKCLKTFLVNIDTFNGVIESTNQYIDASNKKLKQFLDELNELYPKKEDPFVFDPVKFSALLVAVHILGFNISEDDRNKINRHIQVFRGWIEKIPQLIPDEDTIHSLLQDFDAMLKNHELPHGEEKTRTVDELFLNNALRNQIDRLSIRLQLIAIKKVSLESNPITFFEELVKAMCEIKSLPAESFSKERKAIKTHIDAFKDFIDNNTYSPSPEQKDVIKYMLENAMPFDGFFNNDFRELISKLGIDLKDDVGTVLRNVHRELKSPPTTLSL